MSCCLRAPLRRQADLVQLNRSNAAKIINALPALDDSIRHRGVELAGPADTDEPGLAGRVNAGLHHVMHGIDVER